MSIQSLKVHEVLFLLAGLGMIAVLPLMREQGSFGIWLIPKLLYFTGIFFFILNLRGETNARD